MPLVCCQIAVSTLEHLEACHWHVHGKIMHSGAGHSDWLSRANQNCSAVRNVPRLDSNRGRVDFRWAGSFGFGAQSKFTGPSRFPSQMQLARPSVLAPSTIRSANETVWPADSATALSAALRRQSKYHAVLISASDRHVVSCADDPLHVSLARFPSLHVTTSAREAKRGCRGGNRFVVPASCAFIVVTPPQPPLLRTSHAATAPPSYLPLMRAYRACLLSVLLPQLTRAILTLVEKEPAVFLRDHVDLLVALSLDYHESDHRYVSTAAVYRILRFHHHTRKKIERLYAERSLAAQRAFAVLYDEIPLRCVVSVDETHTAGTDMYQRYGRSQRNVACVLLDRDTRPIARTRTMMAVSLTHGVLWSQTVIVGSAQTADDWRLFLQYLHAQMNT